MRLQWQRPPPQPCRGAPAVRVRGGRQVGLQDLRQLGPVLAADFQRGDTATTERHEDGVLRRDHARIGE